MENLVASLQKLDSRPGAHHFCHALGKFKHAVGFVGANIEDLIVTCGSLNACRNDGGHVINITECTGLLAIAKNRHRLPLDQLVHKDPNYVAITIANVLIFPINVVWSKNHKIKAEHLMG